MVIDVARIELETRIAAPPERCFDFARDLDLHLRSMRHTGEHAVDGRTSGLIEFGEEVTWRARHFGFELEHTSRITAFDRPKHFRDSMVSGRFQTFEHDHFFELESGTTLMRDVLEFESPFGILGAVVDELVLVGYLTRLLKERNRAIKADAEKHR